jgi:DNA-binding NarL/FixJ family response regulator
MMPREKLTAKESQVAVLVWQGLTNREIGKIMGTSEQVIKNHLRSTFDKLGVWSRLELAMYVAAHGGRSCFTGPEQNQIAIDQVLRDQVLKKAVGS